MAAGAIKQRLVGAVVLICAGVVLWSLLFTGPKVRQIDRESQIPPAPEKIRINVPDPQPRAVEPVETDLASKPQFDLPVTDVAGEQAAVVDSEKSADSAKPKPAPALPASATQYQDARGLPIAWVVVVGSFADSAKADGIVKQLQQRGHKAFSEKLSRDGRTLYRVSVGPKLEKSQAEKIKPDIDALLKVNASVRQFDNAR